MVVKESGVGVPPAFWVCHPGCRLFPCRADHHRHLCRLETLLAALRLHQACDNYPRCRVLYQQSANPYVAVCVFSCVS